jgi:hypothetical protein
MRTALLTRAILGLTACSQNPDYVQRGYNPTVQPIPGPSVAAVPAPRSDLPTGQGHKVSMTTVNLY